jgi:uncharacterized protein (TIGR02444 family)
MTDASSSSQGSPLWRFSLGFYRVPGVADACIKLQDSSGVDVNLLLYLLWLATTRRAVTSAEIAFIEERFAPWRDRAVIPLRTVRQSIKVPPPAIASAVAEVFRGKVKALELEAERLQQEALYAWSKSMPASAAAESPEAAARASIAAYQEFLAWRFPEDAVESVMTAFLNRSAAQ